MTTPWLTRFYNSRAWKALRLLVLARDGYRCVACGKPANTVHHIKDIAEHPELALDPHNCETRCRRCHGAVDGERGNYKKATMQKPNRFMQTVIGKKPRRATGS
jgi:5-methylcytosine-specific restriction endonuclease McrA